MKIKSNKPRKTIAIRNVFTVLKALFMKYHSAKWQIPAYMVCKLLGPFLSTLIPTIAINEICQCLKKVKQ